MSMKLVASIALLIPLLHPALTVALTNDQCAAGCDVNSAGETIARPVPACPDADGKTTKMNGIEYTLYCTKAVSKGPIEMPDDQHRQADINACINLCNKTPSCESINFFYGSTKWCTLYSERENPPAMDSTGFSSPVIAAVPKIAPGDRFTAADGCPGSDGKTKTLGAISWKISCNKYYGGATVKLTDEPNMQACAAACAANPICEVADYYYEGGANKLKCHQKGTGSWKEIPPNGGVAGLGSLTPTVNPQITNATPLQDSDTCPGIDQKYKKIADRVHKVWCGRAVQGAAVREPYTTQTSRAACMAACTSAADMKTATMAMNWSEKNKWCQCKAVKEDPPSYVNADWWTAVLV